VIIEVEKDFFNAKIKPEFDEESEVAEQGRGGLKYGSTKLDLKVSNLEWEDLEKLYNIAKANKNRSLMIQISAFRNLLEDLEGAKIPNLKALATGLIAYFSEDVIDGWVYKIDEFKIPNPYLITKIEYVPAVRSDDRPYVRVKMVANSSQGGRERLFETMTSFDSDDIQGLTIPQLLSKHGYFHETEELKNEYNRHISLFNKYQPQFNKQFLINGIGYDDLRYSYKKVKFNNVKAINDEEIVDRKFTEVVDPSFWRKLDVEEEFNKVPFHCYIYLFNLNVHKNMWVHVSYLTPYVYDTTLREKLILPQTHRDLIDILVENMDILMEDIIKGKSGGTTILCAGEPGLGKTLSAEVYSEATEKPLYKVHSGQLGLKSDEVERNLEDILKRASRWGAVLLLDEADVYIRRRGNDLQHNAVVASFLRTLEYFDGLLFMTTNRGEDVDDAILSRCIAVIKYEMPSKQDAIRIWKVLSSQFKIDINDDFIDTLTDRFPRISGRDIKELLKLTSRFAKGKNVPLDLEVFRQCAQFRGVEYEERH
jgi:ATPase family associated with various cellular activities (AAA)